MAVDIPCANVMQIAISYQLQSADLSINTRFWHNSVYFLREDGPIDFTNTLTLRNDLFDWWGTYFSPLLPQVVLGRRIDIYDLTTTKTLIQFAGLLLAPGAISGTCAPLNVGLRLEFDTGLEGRSNRGYNTISGLPHDMVDRNTIDPLWIADVVSAYSMLLDIASTNGCAWVVLSRSTAGAPRSAGVTNPVVSVYAKDDHVDSWRGRLNERGF